MFSFFFIFRVPDHTDKSLERQMLPPPDEENIVYTYFKKYKNEQPVAKTATTLYFKAITQDLLLDSSCLKL